MASNKSALYLESNASANSINIPDPASNCIYRLPCGTCIMLKDICPHLNNNVDKITYEPPLSYQLKDFDIPIPTSCERCPNHPNNGGSGICNCILGQQFNVT